MVSCIQVDSNIVLILSLYNKCIDSSFSTTTSQYIVRQFSSKETVTITYVDPTGDEHPVQAEVGQNLLDVAHANNIELEGMDK